jgi:Tol biopolymer transport system component
VPGTPHDQPEVYRRDLQTGTTIRVSVDGSGDDIEGNQPAISADGRFVTFDTGGITNRNIYVRDTQTDTTTLVSVSLTDGLANGDTFGSAISGDGRYVAFGSYASNLVPGDGNATCDAFLRDRQLGTTTRVSVDPSGNDADACSANPRISSDGRYVEFTSTATDLVAGVTNGLENAYVRDTQTGTTTLASAGLISPANAQSSYLADISGDGRYVAFESEATNVVSGAVAGQYDVYVRAVLVPKISAVAPDTLAIGSSQPVVVTGVNFTSDATLGTNTVGVTVGGASVKSDHEIDATVSVAAGAAPGSITFEVFEPGPGPGIPSDGICTTCATIVSP